MQSRTARTPGQALVNALQFVKERRANHPNSMQVISEHGKPVTLKEFITELGNPQQYENLRGYSFWLGGEPGLNASGYCKLDNQIGKLIEIEKMEWETLPPNQRAYAYPENGPLFVDFSADDQRGLIISAKEDPKQRLASGMMFVCGDHQLRMDPYTLRRDAT